MAPEAEQPRDHVRRPDLPWRSATLTECGKSISGVAAWIDRDTFFARIKDDGPRRAAYSTCMTCMDTARRWKTFAEDSVEAMRREFYAGRIEPGLADELRALAALADRYRDEFDGFMAGVGETISLAERRRRARRIPRGRGGNGA